MSVADYASEIRRQILGTPHAVSHSLGYEERPPLGAIVKGSVTFADGSCLHFKKFLQLRPAVTRLKYAYHTMPPRLARWSFDTTMPAILPPDTSPRTRTIGMLQVTSFHPPLPRSTPLCAKQLSASDDPLGSRSHTRARPDTSTE